MEYFSAEGLVLFWFEAFLSLAVALDLLLLPPFCLSGTARRCLSRDHRRLVIVSDVVVALCYCHKTPPRAKSRSVSTV
jgi:hypothetical protein